MKLYRVKEWNHAYDSFFGGRNKGWIYCTNPMNKIQAKIMKLYFKYSGSPGWKYTVEQIKTECD